jgi:hypothetical protein
MSDEQVKPWSTDLAMMNQRIEHNLEMQARTNEHLQQTMDTMSATIVEIKNGQVRLIEVTNAIQILPQLIADIRNLQDEAIAHQSVFSSINDVKKYINRVLTIGIVGAAVMFYTSQYKSSNQKSAEQIVAEYIKQSKQAGK